MKVVMVDVRRVLAERDPVAAELLERLENSTIKGEEQDD